MMDRGDIAEQLLTATMAAAAGASREEYDRLLQQNQQLHQELNDVHGH